MAFGDIAGIKKTGGAPPAEEEERRPLRETPLDLSGLLGPKERQRRTERAGFEQRLFGKLGEPTVSEDVFTNERRAMLVPELFDFSAGSPIEKFQNFGAGLPEPVQRLPGQTLEGLDIAGRQGGTSLGESLAGQLFQGRQKEEYYQRLDALFANFRMFTGREPTRNEEIDIRNRALNPQQIPFFTGALEVAAALGTIPLDTAAIRGFSAAGSRITRTRTLQQALDIAAQREAAVTFSRGATTGQTSATEIARNIELPKVSLADDVAKPVAPVSRSGARRAAKASGEIPELQATVSGRPPDLLTVAQIDAYADDLNAVVLAARGGRSMTTLPSRQLKRLREAGIGPQTDISDIVDELAELGPLRERTLALDAAESAVPSAAKRPPAQVRKPIPVEEPRQVLPPQPEVPPAPTAAPTRLPGTAPLAADVAEAVPPGPPSLLRESLERQLLTRGGAEPLVPGAAPAARPISQGFAQSLRPQPNQDLASLGGRFANEQADEVIMVRGLLRDAKNLRTKIEELQSQELSAKAKNITDIFATEDDVFAAARKANAAMTGDLTKGNMTPLLPNMTDDQVRSMMRMVQTSPDVTPFERFRAMRLVNPESPESILTGHLPTMSDVGTLEKVYGSAFADVLADVVGRSGWQQIGMLATDVWNLPKTIFSSYDISAFGRQGMYFVGAEPRISKSAFMAQLQAMKSERVAQVFYRSIWQHPDADLLLKAKVFIADINPSAIAGAGSLSGREEAYMSRFFQKMLGAKWAQHPLAKPITLPAQGIRASERAYVTYLNKVRADVFYKTIEEWRAAGGVISDAKLRNLGRFINNASGRGGLGFLEKSRPVLNGLFFAPGLQAARFGLLRALFDPTVSAGIRRQIYMSTAKSLGLVTTIMGMMDLAGADVTLDWRSSDFGKVRIGDTSYDFTGGLSPYFVFAAQAITGKARRRAGDVVDINEFYGRDLIDQSLRVGRGKLSPGAAGILDVIKGETFIGDETLSGSNFLNTFTPGAIQELVDAIQTEGAVGIGMGLPAFLGIGVNSYHSTGELQNAASALIPVSQDEIDTIAASDPKEVADLQEGDIGVSYTLRAPYIRALIDEDPEIAERFEEFRESQKKVSTVDLRNIVHGQKDEFTEMSEAWLLAEVRKGTQGAGMRPVVQGFLRDRAIANEAIFTDEFDERVSKVPLLLRDRLALEYWTADIREQDDGQGNVGAVNFDLRDRTRKDVLRQAREAKIRVSYITGIGENSWRGDLSANPEVNKLLTDYTKAMETVRPYWEIGDDPNYAGAFNRDEWQEYLEEDDAIRRRELARDSSVIKRALKKQGEERLAFRQNEDIDKALVQWYGYLPETIPGRGLYNRLYVEAA